MTPRPVKVRPRVFSGIWRLWLEIFVEVFGGQGGQIAGKSIDPQPRAHVWAHYSEDYGIEDIHHHIKESYS